MGLWAMTAGSAAAQDRERNWQTDNGGGFAFTVENDLFVPGDNTDRYYTQGMKLSVLTGDRPTGPLVETFLGVRYSVELEGGKRAAFLGVRQTGPRTIWCSTTSSVRPEEIEAAMTVCRSLSWEG